MAIPKDLTEPPVAGSEAATLVGSLERLRRTFLWKAEGLEAEGLAVTVGTSSLSLGSLLRHLAMVEDLYFQHHMDDKPLSPYWDVTVFEDWDRSCVVEPGTTPEQLYSEYAAAVHRSREAVTARLAVADLDQRVHLADRDGNHASLRSLLATLVEEYGRHTGHADVLREAVDGRVGEDPPDDFRV